VDPRWRSADVLAAATTVVTGLFDRSPDLDSGGGFGKLLTPTRVLAALQRTPGVIGAVLHELRTAGAGGDAVTEVLAKPAAARNGTVTAAELLTPGTIDIGEVVP
jgi:hypothetical protein